MAQRFGAGLTGTCPHCGTGVQFVEAQVVENAGNSVTSLNFVRYRVGPDSERKLTETQSKTIPADRVEISACRCPKCQLLVIQTLTQVRSQTSNSWDESDPRLIYPRRANRKPVPLKVPKGIAEDYYEAALVLEDSPKASAALSRRCLQHLLQDNGHAQKDLEKQIESAIPSLPSDITSLVDAVRQVGNFAAHPVKSQSTGEIVAVEPGEAELLLEVLDELFDYYYARPDRIERRRTEVNEKLKAAGKPLLTGSSAQPK